MPDDQASLEFSRSLLAPKDPARWGETIPSILLGVLTIGLGLLNLSALFNRGLSFVPALVKRATIVLVEPTSRNNFGGKYAEGWWYVPETGYWILSASALALAGLGVLHTFRRGRPIFSGIGFGFNAILVITGFILVFTDYQN